MFILDQLNANTFCTDSIEVWKFVGTLLLIFKIVIPILLIVLGAIDLGKAVISSDEKAISKSVKSFAMRILAALVIFFIPAIVSAIFGMVDSFNKDVKGKYEVCRKCVVSPGNCG